MTTRRPGSAPSHSGLWRNGDFARYGAAQVLSTAGSNVTTVSLPVLAAIDLHASTFQVALLAATVRLPPLLLSLPVGALVDRFPKRPVLLVCETAAGIMLVTLPLMSLVTAPTLAQLYAVAFTVSALGLIGSTASISYLPQLVDPARMVEANARLGTGNSAADLVGTNLGGALVGALGATRAVGADCLSYLISAALLTRIRVPEPVPTRPGVGRSLRHDIRAGLDFVWRHPTLRSVILSNTATSSAMAASAALFSLVLLRELHWSPAALGMVLGAGGAGGIAGGLLTQPLSRRLAPSGLVLTCLAIAPVCQIPILLVGPGLAGQVAVGAAMFLQTGSAVTGGSIMRSLRQLLTPPELQGRTQAAATWLAFGLRPAAALAAGVSGTLAGLRPTLALTALLLTVPFLMVWRSPVRRLDRLPEPHTPSATSGPSAPEGVPVPAPAATGERR